MEVLINHPAIQSGALPFAISLGGCLILGRLGRYGTAVGLLSGLVVSMVLVVGWQFMPLTSTRKLLLITLGAIVLAATLDIRALGWRTLLPFTVAGAAACGIWLVWPVLMRRESLELVALIAVAVLYTAWITTTIDVMHNHTVKALSATFALGVGTGVSAMLGASAFLGQLGLTIAAATGGAALAHFTGFGQTAGRVWTLPVGLSLALVAVAAVVYAKLPREALLLLALVPLVALIPLPSRFSGWLRLMITTILCLVPAGAAILLTWRIAGGVPM